MMQFMTPSVNQIQTYTTIQKYEDDEIWYIYQIFIPYHIKLVCVIISIWYVMVRY